MDLIGGIGKLFPGLATRYLERRARFDLMRQYQAAKSSQYRPGRTNLTSGDGAMMLAGTKLRQIARDLDENHDLAVGVLDDLTNNIVGAGVQVAPMIRKLDGSLDPDANRQMSELFDEWADSPETTGELGFEQVERLLCRSWLRDGEVFALDVATSRFNYRTPVPYVLELLESDLVSFDYGTGRTDRDILQGVEVNGWGAPVAYYVYKMHPGDPRSARTFVADSDVKRVAASRANHLKFVRRLRQRRGVPILHSVIERLRDVKDYEESERIAAKVAAELTFFIQRTSEYQGQVNVDEATKNRTLEMSAGAGFELLPGESVGTIKSERPNTGLEAFRDAMLRAVSAGTSTRFSSIARNYNGTYSAQRQELVEATVGYRSLFGYLARRFYKPTYQNFARFAVLSGAFRVPRGVDRSTLLRADFRAPALPWIDPKKEADAFKVLLDAKLESHSEIIRQRGRDPLKVREEIEQEKADGVFASDVAEIPDGAVEIDPPPEDSDDEQAQAAANE